MLLDPATFPQRRPSGCCKATAKPQRPASCNRADGARYRLAKVRGLDSGADDYLIKPFRNWTEFAHAAVMVPARAGVPTPAAWAT